VGATGYVTDLAKNTFAAAFGTAAPYLALLKALTLQTGVAAGATSISVDLSVAAGDQLVLERGTANEESVIVGSPVTGTGPYTVPLASSLTKAHASGTFISHMPLTSATVHEVAVTRVAASWGAPSPAGQITSAAAAFTSIPASTVVGSLAAFTALTGGNYFDSTPVPAQQYPTGGSGTATWVEIIT
jgi:hypothetical protein